MYATRRRRPVGGQYGAMEAPRRWSGSAVRVSASVLGAVIVVAGCGASAPTPPRTVGVTRASVSTSVSAVGSVSIEPGQRRVREGRAADLGGGGVGDASRRGEVLATVDTSARRRRSGRPRPSVTPSRRPRPRRGLDGGRRCARLAGPGPRVLAATERVAASRVRPAVPVRAGAPPRRPARWRSGSTARTPVSCRSRQRARRCVAAQNDLDAAEADRPHPIDAAQAAVDGARAGVDNAERDLANTTLRAPIGGRSPPSTARSASSSARARAPPPQAPGGDAADPRCAAASAGAARRARRPGRRPRPGPAAPSSSCCRTRPRFSVVAPFQEIDAAAIAPGQRADVTRRRAAGRHARRAPCSRVAPVVEPHLERHQLLRHGRRSPPRPAPAGRADRPGLGGHRGGRRRAERARTPPCAGRVTGPRSSSSSRTGSQAPDAGSPPGSSAPTAPRSSAGSTRASRSS